MAYLRDEVEMLRSFQSDISSSVSAPVDMVASYADMKATIMRLEAELASARAETVKEPQDDVSVGMLKYIIYSSI